MLSRNDIKTIKSLGQKKFRLETGLFVAEGPKLVSDLSGHFHCRLLAATKECLDSHPELKADRIECVSHDELEKASFLTSPQNVTALFSIPEYSFSLNDAASRNLVLALDAVQDPGNLGTIVRIADWFGIKDIVCSKDTADIYNPKAVQATMGAMARVRLHYLDLEKELRALKGKTAIFGTFLDGRDIYATELEKNGIIVMGNEGNGISPEIEAVVSHRLYVPNWPKNAPTSESLNVAVATAVVCAEFRRRQNS